MTELELVRYLSLLSRVFNGTLEVSLPVVLCSTITVSKSVRFPEGDDGGVRSKYLRLVAPISFAKASAIVVWGSTRDRILGCGRWMIEIWKA